MADYFGGEGNDTLTGGSGYDYLWGYGGDDRLNGGGGFDVMHGGAGNDRLDGGLGSDYYDPGAGDDLCVIYIGDGAIDEINGYTPGGGFTPGGTEDEIYINFAYVHSFAQLMTVASEDQFYTVFDFGDAGMFRISAHMLNSLTADDFIFSRPAVPSTKAPTDIVLTGSGFYENYQKTSAGLLTVTDPDGDNFFTLTLSDNRFEIVNNWNGTYDLRLKSGMPFLDYETEPAVELDITVTDPGGFSFQKHFSIPVHDSGGRDIIGTAGDDLVDATHTVAGWQLPAEDDDLIRGLEGNDTLSGLMGNDTIRGDEGNDTLYGGGGNDWLIGDDGNDALYGGDGNDILVAGDGNNFVYGGDGDDSVNGGSGVDYLDGGAGNDSFSLIGSEAFFDTIIGGEGIDTVVTSGADPIVLPSFSPDNSIELFWGAWASTQMWGTDSDNILDFSGMITAVLGTTFSADGRGGNDVIKGLQSASELNGGAGNDALYGGAGNDSLDGGAGNDTLTGGGGNDTFIYRALGGVDVVTDFTAGGTLDGIYFDGLAGVRSFFQAIQFATQDGDDTVFDFGNGQVLTLSDVTLEDLTADDFSFSDPLPPSYYAPSDIALAVNTVAENSAGAIVGALTVTDLDGETEFTFAVSDDRFEVVTDANGYWLSLKSGVALDFETEPSVVLEITAFDSGGLSRQEEFSITVEDRSGAIIIGTKSNNTISGTQTVSGQALASDEDDTINGMAGNDTLWGLGGDDTVSGGAGNDVINGGEGDDALYGQAGADNINGGAGNDSIYITGTEASADTIDGGDGVDTIVVTGLGNVTLAGLGVANHIEIWSGNNAALLGTSGNNVFDLSALTSRSGLLYLDGAGGNDTLTGSDLADDLRGGAGNDTISGGDGNDSLYGGAGVDNINGGLGNDTIYIAATEASADTMNGGDGIDTIQVLGTGNVTLAGFGSNDIEIWAGNNAAVVGTKTGGDILDFSGLTSKTGLSYIDGGGGNDVITGTSFADDLRGNGGNDILDGGAGNDLLNGGKGVDTYVFNGTFGNDTIVGFTAGITSSHDVIQFDDAQFANFADVMAHATQVGTSVVIALDGSNSVTLQSMTLVKLVDADFQFV